MILYFTDRHLNIIGHASTELPKGITISDDLREEDIETGVASFECMLHYNKNTRSKVESWANVGNYILRFDDGETELYTITDNEISTKKQSVYVYAEDDGLDLLNEVFGEYEADKAYSIEHYINLFAAESGFEIGINEIPNLKKKLSWDNEATASARIADVATQFDGAEVSYSFQVNGLYVVRKFINIYKERGIDAGVTLRLNKDIDEIVSTKSITNLATALQCTGGAPEDEKDESDHITLKGYSYDDGDFFIDNKGMLKSRKALQTWSRLILKDGKAQQQGGYITKQFYYNTASQKELLEKAIVELKKLREMEINYSVEIPKLPDNVKIGDRINIVDDEGELYLSARILKLEKSVVDREQRVTLGEYLIKSSGISQKVAALAAQFAQNATSASRALTIANNAKSAANTAQQSANDALERTTNALTAAENANAAAQQAAQSANNAQTAASNAQTAVGNVQEQVSGMETSIANAQQAAAQAQQAAQTAETKASEAKTAAENAQTKANETAQATQTAQETANEAVGKADTAKTAAEKAISDAEKAATTAAAAKLDAEQAKKEIDALGEDLTTLSNTMTAEYARKTDLTEAEASLKSQITQNAAQISSTVSKVEMIDETANNAAIQAAAAYLGAEEAQRQATEAQTLAEEAQAAADEAQALADEAQAEADIARAAADTAQAVLNNANADLQAAQADLETVLSRADATQEEIEQAQQAVADAQAAAGIAQTNAETAIAEAEAAQATADTAANNALDAQAEAIKARNNATIAQKAAEQANGSLASQAQETANTAKQTALNAQATASTAVSNAQNAQSIADAAARTAAAAQTAANEAETKAAAAQSDLNAAKQNLAEVTSRVGATEEEVAAAQKAVTDAQAAADKAKADAAAAQSTADTAKTNAQTAQTAANNAKTAADAAQAAANAAKAAADSAQSAVNALTVRVTKTETDFVQTNEKIELLGTKIVESSDEVRQEIVESSSKVLLDAENITLEHLKKYISEDAFNAEMMTYVSTQLRLLDEALQAKITSVENKTNSVDTDLQTKYNLITKYFDFTINGLEIKSVKTDADGNEILSPYKIVIDNDNQTTYANGAKVQIIDAITGEVLTPKLTVTEGFKLLGYQIQKNDTTGNVDWEYIGG